MMEKAPEALRSISETAKEIGVPQHVLRFWEHRFAVLRPVKASGARRYYRPQDILLLRAIHRLLHDEGYTIRGVNRLIKEKGVDALTNGAPPTPQTDNVWRKPVNDALAELEKLRTLLMVK